jgi:hypothetical protein
MQGTSTETADLRLPCFRSCRAFGGRKHICDFTCGILWMLQCRNIQ